MTGTRVTGKSADQTPFFGVKEAAVFGDGVSIGHSGDVIADDSVEVFA